MDGATHFIIPYAAALLALGAWRSNAPRNRVAWAVAFGIGGWAPDADVLFDWLTKPLPQLYFLQHRGLSHSLVGAPIFALFLMAVLAWPASRWKSMQLLRWAPATLLAMMLGSLTHLVLDGVTYGGVPMFWPFASGRVMWPVFNWLVIWMFPIGILAIILHLWGKLDRRAMAAVGCLLVLVIVVLGAVRLSSQPDAPVGGLVYSRATGEWMVFAPVEGGWTAEMMRDGGVVATAYYNDTGTTQASAAIDAARATSEYKGFAMGLFGPEVVQAEPWQGGWNVSFIAVAHRFDAENNPRWTPAEPKESWGLNSFHVDAVGGVLNTVRGW